MNVYKVLSMPASPQPNGFYYVLTGGKVEFYMTDSSATVYNVGNTAFWTNLLNARINATNGLLGLNGSGVAEYAQLPFNETDIAQVAYYPTYTALPANPGKAMIAIVKNAIADPNVNDAVTAIYGYNPIDNEWLLGAGNSNSPAPVSPDPEISFEADSSFLVGLGESNMLYIDVSTGGMYIYNGGWVQINDYSLPAHTHDASNIVSGFLSMNRIDSNVITFGKIQQMAANSIAANATGGIANMAELVAPDNTIIGRINSNLRAIPIAELKSVFAQSFDETTAIGNTSSREIYVDNYYTKVSSSKIMAMGSLNTGSGYIANNTYFDLENQEFACFDGSVKASGIEFNAGNIHFNTAPADNCAFDWIPIVSMFENREVKVHMFEGSSNQFVYADSNGILRLYTGTISGGATYDGVNIGAGIGEVFKQVNGSNIFEFRKLNTTEGLTASTNGDMFQYVLNGASALNDNTVIGWNDATASLINTPITFDIPSGSTFFAGSITVTNDAIIGDNLQVLSDSAFSAGWEAQDGMTGDYLLNMPITGPGNNQVMIFNSSGIGSWVTLPSSYYNGWNIGDGSTTATVNSGGTVNINMTGIGTATLSGTDININVPNSNVNYYISNVERNALSNNLSFTGVGIGAFNGGVGQFLFQTISPDSGLDAEADSTNATLQLHGDGYLTTTGSGTPWNIQINHPATGLSAGSPPSGQYISGWTVDSKGHINGFSYSDLPAGSGGGDPDQNLWLTFSDATTNVSASTTTDTFTFLDDSYLSAIVNAIGKSLTISHPNTGLLANTIAAGQYINGWTVDGKGHISSFTTDSLPTFTDTNDIDYVSNVTLDINNSLDFTATGNAFFGPIGQNLFVAVFDDTIGSVIANATNTNLRIKGDGYLTSTANNSLKEIEIAHPAIGLISGNTPGGQYVSGWTVDSAGHITSFSYSNLPTPNANQNLWLYFEDDATNVATASSETDLFYFYDDNYLTAVIDGVGNSLTVGHPDTGLSAGAPPGGQYISGWTVDTKGHITGFSYSELPAPGAGAQNIWLNFVDDAANTAVADNTTDTFTFSAPGSYMIVEIQPAADTLNIDHPSIGLSAGNTPSNQYIKSWTVDNRGHITGFTYDTLPSPNANQNLWLNFVDDAANTATASTTNDTFTFSAPGNYMNLEIQPAQKTLNIDHPNIGLLAGSTPSNEFIKSWTVDAKGHITGFTYETLPSFNYGWTISDGTATDIVNDGDILSILSGGGVIVSLDNTNPTAPNVTINHSTIGAPALNLTGTDVLQNLIIDPWGHVIGRNSRTLSINDFGGPYDNYQNWIIEVDNNSDNIVDSQQTINSTNVVRIINTGGLNTSMTTQGIAPHAQLRLGHGSTSFIASSFTLSNTETIASITFDSFGHVQNVTKQTIDFSGIASDYIGNASGPLGAYHRQGADLYLSDQVLFEGDFANSAGGIYSGKTHSGNSAQFYVGDVFGGGAPTFANFNLMHVEGALSTGISTISGGLPGGTATTWNDYDVKSCNTIFNTASNNQIIRGLKGGVYGQYLHIINTSNEAIVTVYKEPVSPTGNTQPVNLVNTATNIDLGENNGLHLVCNGIEWYEVNDQRIGSINWLLAADVGSTTPINNGEVAQFITASDIFGGGNALNTTVFSSPKGVTLRHQATLPGSDLISSSYIWSIDISHGHVVDINSAAQPVFSIPSNKFEIVDNTDNTKKIVFDASAISTGISRTIIMPDSNVDLGNIASGSHTHTTSDITDLSSYIGFDSRYYTKTEINGILNGTMSVSSITGYNRLNWNQAYNWGDHSVQGYLTSFTETDPIFSASPAGSITNTNITNWNTSFAWGDHSAQGYATESWVINQGYLSSFTETDPIYSASVAASITSGDITNWNNLINHSLGYHSDVNITSSSIGQTLRYNGTNWVNSLLSSTDISNFTSSVSTVITTDVTKTFVDNLGINYNSLSNLPTIPSSLADLNDVVAGTPSISMPLVRNGLNNGWEPGEMSVNHLKTTGTANASTFLRGDGQWSTVPVGAHSHTTTDISNLSSYTGFDARYYTETEINNFFGGTGAPAGYNKSNWDTAFGWGNHASEGYATQAWVTAQNYLTTGPAFTQTDFISVHIESVVEKVYTLLYRIPYAITITEAEIILANPNGNTVNAVLKKSGTTIHTFTSVTNTNQAQSLNNTVAIDQDLELDCTPTNTPTYDLKMKITFTYSLTSI